MASGLSRSVPDRDGGWIVEPDRVITALGSLLDDEMIDARIRTGAGQLVWRFDRDGPKPRPAISQQVATDMVGMMSHVVDEGTARRAGLDGIHAAGKTGTTNSYRDAWFVGYTGNFVCGVWYGNDDYSSTNRMTGGSLPAQTWHDIMTYTHQGVELKNLPGLGPNQGPGQQVAAAGSANGPDVAPRMPVLTRRGADVLTRVERMMDDATRALAAASTAPPSATEGRGAAVPQRGAFASASDAQAADRTGN